MLAGPRVRSSGGESREKERKVVTSHQHVGLRVSNMDRSVAFYGRAFGAETVIEPFVVEGGFAELVMGGPEGVRWRMAILRAGTAVFELFEFETPNHPINPVHPTAGNIVHVALQVDDVAETVARVESAGGKRIWPEVIDLAPEAQVIYVADPDENVIELLNVDVPQLIALLQASTPSADLGS